MNKLPTLAELHHDGAQAFRNDQLSILLNYEPPAYWLKKHPLAGTLYLPIERVETLLTQIFQEYRIEVISTNVIFNSVAVHVRLHYKHPLTGEWRYHDGVGAKAVQTNKGESAANLAAIKADGVEKALPTAKSLAIKDACDHLGKLFGRDLNRKEQIPFESAYTEQVHPKPNMEAPAGWTPPTTQTPISSPINNNIEL